MKTAPPTRPIQILTLTLVGVGLLVTLASAVIARRPAQAEPPAAQPIPPAAASPTATSRPSPTVPVPAWPPPTLTPITDLMTLVQQSVAVAHVEITGTIGAMHSHMVYIRTLEWFKKPAQSVVDAGMVWIPNPFAHEFTPPRLSWIGDGDEAILFLRPAAGPNPWDADDPEYELTGAPGGDSAIYQIRDGRISDAGLPQYQGWSVADFAAAIRATLPTPPPPSPSPPPPPSPGAPDRLAHLAQKAEVIAEAEGVDSNGAAGWVMITAQVKKWWKKPDGLTPTSFAYRLGSTPADRMGRVHRDCVLFLVSAGPEWKGTLYNIVDEPNPVTGEWDEFPEGIFCQDRGIITHAGLPEYTGWAVKNFEAAIRAVLPRPELGLLPIRHWPWHGSG